LNVKRFKQKYTYSFVFAHFTHILHFLFSNLLRKTPFFETYLSNLKISRNVTTSSLSSSQVSVQVGSSITLVIKSKTMYTREDKLNVLAKLICDLEGLKANGIDMVDLLRHQGWLPFVNMLNGKTYSNLMKYFSVRAKIYDRWAHEEELRQEREKCPKKVKMVILKRLMK